MGTARHNAALEPERKHRLARFDFTHIDHESQHYTPNDLESADSQNIAACTVHPGSVYTHTHTGFTPNFLFFAHAINVFLRGKPHHPQTPSFKRTPSCIGVRCVTWCDMSREGVPVLLRGDEASKAEGWSLSLPQPWQDLWAQIESRRVWSSFSELLLFNCDLQECVRYGNLSRNSRYGLSKSIL